MIIKPIPNLSGYGCDILGNIYFIKSCPYRIRKLRKNKDGYLRFNAQSNGINKTFSVHRCIAETWLSHRVEQVNHKDGNKENNRLENLEWVTQADNNLHAIKVLKLRIGKNHSNSKINEKDVKKIRSSKETLSNLAKKYNLGTSQIWRIKRRETWTHVK